MFQSSPAPRRGRSIEHPLPTLTNRGFNPRPRRGAGAPWPTVGVRGFTNVSILARAEARALLELQKNPLATEMFQSSPAPRRGRSHRVHIRACHARCFNPRPRRGAGAPIILPSIFMYCVVSILARAEARALQGYARVRRMDRLFQSSPAPRRGRSVRRGLWLMRVICFNPRPRRGAGAPLIWQASGTAVAVSILARAEARALPLVIARVAQWAEFQSSPAPRRGRSAYYVQHPDHSSVFQSSPAPRRGRSTTPTSQVVRYCRFNPRPRRGAGAPPVKCDIFEATYVSILARAEARALPTCCRSKRCTSARFNPRPRRGAGAPFSQAGKSGQVSFQSSPAPRRGRSLNPDPVRP